MKEIDISTWHDADSNHFLPGSFSNDITMEELAEQLKMDLPIVVFKMIDPKDEEFTIINVDEIALKFGKRDCEY